MALLGESERQDFWALITQRGYSKDDFELTELEDKPTSVGIYAITGAVTVRRKSTGISRQYRAGHAMPWLADFEAELRGHMFGVA